MPITRERKSDIAGRQTGGEVTRVLVDAPVRGYGDFIENAPETAR